MVLEHDPSRVIWVDFDRAQTFDPGNVSDRQKEWLDHEVKLVDELDRSMVCFSLCGSGSLYKLVLLADLRQEADSKEGRVDNTALFYY